MKRFLTVIIAFALGLAACFGARIKFNLPEGNKKPGEITVLFIGNSFTYYHDSEEMLKNIFESQGISIRIGEYLKGGQTFGQHLQIPESRQAVKGATYDFAFLQDQSVNPARLIRDKDEQVLNDFLELRRNIIMKSPDCKVILERTWSYSGKEAGGFGTKEELEKNLVKGVKMMARKGHSWISPIGEAFMLVEKEHPEIKLLGKDDKHQSPEGSYLKACVNYLVITGKKFEGEPWNGDISPEVASILRNAAERTVLGHEGRYRIRRERR